MELDLKKVCLDTYETGGELTITQDETAETIVPDYSPDIARVIETDGRVYIHSREMKDGKAEVSGTVRITVLYTPEQETGVRSLEFSIPFTVEGDQRMSGCVFLMAETEAETLETRMLNPRKVFTHCKLVTRLAGYRKQQVCFCSDVEADGTLQIEKRREVQKAVFLTQIAEKDFTFSETMKLPMGREGIAELLSKQVRSVVTEIKSLGSKLIFKGIFYVSVLYKMPAGNCGVVSGELPFSQIMEVDGTAEDAVVSLLLQFTGMEFRLDDGASGGRQIEVTLYLHATASLRETRELMLLNDLYSTAYEVKYEPTQLELHGFYETVNCRQMAREVLEVGATADTILAATVTCRTVFVGRERGNAVLRTRAGIRVLYLDEGGVPLMAERSADVSCQMELPENCRITARADCVEEVQGSIGERGIEVRFPVDFRIETTNQIKKGCIDSAELNPVETKDLGGVPSLVLRRFGQQESVWDLAKKHRTTIGAILAANQAEKECDLPQDSLILIPRKRA
jgi:hypothetical protein